MKQILLLLLIILLSACTEQVVRDAYFTQSGNIIGRVRVINEYGNETNDNSGVFVILASNGKIESTDKDGKWIMKIDEPGFYDFQFYRNDCDSNFLKHVEYFGNGDAYAFVSNYGQYRAEYLYIFQKSTARIYLDSIFIIEELRQIGIKGEISKKAPYMLYFDTSAAVSKFNYMQCVSIPAGKTINYIVKEKIEKIKKMYDTLYLVAYPGGNVWYNKRIVNGKIIYMGLGKKSNVLSIKL
jgi:hypothetical protein